jgi:hypothetical protein
MCRTSVGLRPPSVLHILERIKINLRNIRKKTRQKEQEIYVLLLLEK